MKLRLRSIETGETLRIQLPSPSPTLHQLQQILAQTISLPLSPSTLHFSLNRTDELQPSSPEAPLQSLGLTSGDLLYYSLQPTFQTPHQQTINLEPQIIQNPDSQESFDQEHINPEPQINRYPDDLQDSKDMEVDEGFVDMATIKTPEPCFSRILREELGDDFTAQRMLVIAVHAILLESGFIGFDMVSGTTVERIHLPEHWPSRNSPFSVWYTLPELVNNSSGGLIECVVLKFQCIGDLVNVYGCLAREDVGLHKLFLSRNKYAPDIALMLTDSDKKDLQNENAVFEFWKMVKDSFALPLSIDLCERTGLEVPACLMRLPTELKVTILEALPAVDVAKMCCVCYEMRYLASNNDLWKRKYEEEFGTSTTVVDAVTKWKQIFVSAWLMNKKRKRAAERHFFLPRPVPYLPLGRPSIVGYDPAYSIYEPPFGQLDRLTPFGVLNQPGSSARRRHNFSPNCQWRLNC